MRILIGIPHVFRPQEGSSLSSQTATKRELKRRALREVSLGNLDRHSTLQWVHRYRAGHWITEEQPADGHHLIVELHTLESDHLLEGLINDHPQLRHISHTLSDPSDLPLRVSRSLLERASDYDMVVYLEDDIAIHDRELFDKVAFLVGRAGSAYAFMPHRCETKAGLGAVVLAGDPTEPRADLPWATGERLDIDWLGTLKQFYRATNPHAGCFLLTRPQAMAVAEYWRERHWTIPFHWAGKCEMASTGLFLPILKLMKIVPCQARHFQVEHQDCLWQGIPAP